MADGAEQIGGAGRTIAGLVLILGAAPVFLWLIWGSRGWTVILGGLAALGVLVSGIVLAGHWLGVFRRRGVGSFEHQGCLPLLVTLVALVAGALIVYYVAFYGAGANLGGEL